MTTRCKFICNAVTKRRDYGRSDTFAYTAEFSAVTNGSTENQQFFKFTPGGSLSITAYRDDLFVPGKSYYLDITEAPDGLQTS